MIRRLSLPVLGLALLTFVACDGSQQPAEPDSDVDGAVTRPLLTHKEGAEHGKPGGGDEPETYSVEVVGDISGSDVSTAAARDQILTNDFELDLTWFLGKLSCDITGTPVHVQRNQALA